MSYKSNENFVKFVQEMSNCGFKMSLLDLRLIELKIYEDITNQISTKLTEYNDINKVLINKGLLVDEVFEIVVMQDNSRKQEKTDLQKLELYKVIAIYINDTLDDYLNVIKKALSRITD